MPPPRLFFFFFLIIAVASAFFVAPPPPPQQQQAPTTTALYAGGFASQPAQKNKKKKRAASTNKIIKEEVSSSSSLRPEDGWVELRDLDRKALDEGRSQAVGRSINGKPYLVRRRSADEGIAAIGVECGRCQYPLLKAPIQVVDGADQVTCGMCGAAFDASTGAPRGEGGTSFLAPLLRNKPHQPLPSYPTKQLPDGRVFVNISPSS